MDRDSEGKKPLSSVYVRGRSNRAIKHASFVQVFDQEFLSFSKALLLFANSDFSM